MTIILDRDQLHDDTQVRDVPVEPSAGDQGRFDAHVSAVASSNPPGGRARADSTTGGRSPNPRGFSELRLLAESFEDIQKARIATENRLRSGADKGPVAKALKALTDAERNLGLAMRRSFRKVAPEVAAWVKETPGVGEHLVARLIGCIGHPVIASPYHWEGEGRDNRKLVADPPYVRSVSQLWSYCGHGDAARKKRKGMSAEEAMALGNPRAKMIVHLIAEGCMKCVGSAKFGANPIGAPPTDTDLSGDHVGGDTQRSCVPADHSENGDGSKRASTPSHGAVRRRSPYRDVYDLGRLTYAGRDDWSPAHQHNAALRLAGKAFLRDLWVAAAGDEVAS